MVRGSTRRSRVGLPVLGSLVVLAGLLIVGIDMAGPSGAQPLTAQVLPPTSTFNDPVAVSSHGTHVWVANKRGNSVTELDAATGALVQVFAGPSYGFDSPDAVASDGVHVWVANAFGNSVTELSATTGALVQVISAGTPPSNPSEYSPTAEFDWPTAICSNGNEVWVLNNNGFLNRWSVTGLVASTGALIQTIQGPTNASTDAYMGISCDASHAWVANGGYWTGNAPNQVLQTGFVTELDAATVATTQVISSTSLGNIFPVGISSDGTHVWVANLGGASVAELSAATGTLVQVVSLSGYGNIASYVSSDGIHVWVGASNNLVQLNAATGAVEQGLPVASDGIYADFQKLSSDGTHLWVVNTTNQNVTEFDAVTGSLLQVVPVNADGFSNPIAVSSDSTHVWVANQSGSVSELDASTGALVQVISGPTYDFGFGDFTTEADAISSDGVHVWVANPVTNAVTELDASTGALVQVIAGSSIGMREPFAVSSDGTHVWVTDSSTKSVSELDASTGALVQVLSDSTFAFSFPWTISSDGTHVWVGSLDNSTITELSAVTGALVKVTTGFFTTGVSSDGTHVWASGGSSVHEFSAATGALVQTISPPGLSSAQAISSDGTDVWVTSTANNELMELDASTGTLVQTVSASADGFNWPGAISSDGANVWVTNQYGNSVTDLGTGVLVQHIVFTSTPPSDGIGGGPTYTVSATGGASGNPVTFTVDPSATSVCSISGGDIVSFTVSGTCVIDANQAAGNGYPAAAQAQQSFIVGGQHITFTSTPPSNGIVGGTPYTVSATGGASGNPVTFTVDPSATSVCSISGGDTVSFTTHGTCVLDANQAAGNGYGAAPQAQQSFVVGAQKITFTSRPTSYTVGGPLYTVTATGGGSGNPVILSSDSPTVCTVSGSTVNLVGAGWCTIAANQTGNADFSAAPTALQVWLVFAGNGNPQAGPCASASISLCFTSAASDSTPAGLSFSFPVTTAGSPSPKITEKGKLPRGVKFYKGTGSARIAGKPVSTARKSSVGTYQFTLTATYGKGTTKHVVTQTFALTIT